MPNGFINLYKNSGISSNKALSILKSVLKENNIITKVGHLGTLDPLAEGVLPVAIGRATRLFEYTLDKVKSYTATFKFGILTDTLDTEGEIIKQDGTIPTSAEIENILPKMVGEVEQMPPAFSAKSVNGVRAYKLARRGLEVPLEPKKITIYSLNLIEKLDESTYKFDISCSGGTYIRSIVRDMAKLLNTYGIMTALIRTKSGYFDIKNCVRLENLKENIIENIIPMENIIEDMPIYIVEERYAKPLLNGVALSLNNLPDGNFQLYYDKNLIGIAKKDENNNLKINTWLI